MTVRAGVTMRAFAGVGTLYGPHWPARLRPDLDAWDSVELMLGGYLYERQGSPRLHSQAAVDVVRDLKRRGRPVELEPTARTAWNRFARVVNDRGLGLNPKNNPMARDPMRGKLSVIDLGREVMDQHGCTVVSYVRDELEAQRTASIHSWLKRVSGVGDKLASFLLRDVALVYEVPVQVDRHLLQPLDLWVNRSAASCLSVQVDVGQAIVEASVEEGADSELVNAGMWYFGARVAGTTYRLDQALVDRRVFWSMVEEHVESLQRTVEAHAGRR